VAPIFVPPTPNGELAARLRKTAATEAEAGVNFRIVETGGRSGYPIPWRQQVARTKTAYRASLVMEMEGDASALEQTMCWNVSCAQMGRRVATLVRHPETFTPGAWSMRVTTERAAQHRSCRSTS
jgi:hypothetical protein